MSIPRALPPYAGDNSERIRRRALITAASRAVVPIVAASTAPELAQHADLDFASEVKVLGTAFRVDERGYYLTAAHVLARWMSSEAPRGHHPSNPQLLFVHKIHAAPPNKVTIASVIAGARAVVADDNIDLAALWLPPDDQTRYPPPLVLSDEPADEGDRLFVLGFPFGMQLVRAGIEDGFIGALLTEGVVSKVMPFPKAPPDNQHLFQTDAVICPGTSGGPALDTITGLVVGVAVEAHERKVHGIVPFDIPTGLGHVVPIRRAIAVLQDLHTLVEQQGGASGSLSPPDGAA